MTMSSSVGVWILGCVLVGQLTSAQELVAVTVILQNMALNPSSLPVVHKKLDVVPLEEIQKVLNEGLRTNFKDVDVTIVDCPDLTKEPFALAKPGIGGNTKLVEVGGPPYLLPTVQRDKVYDLRDIAKLANAENSFIIGAGAGPYPYAGKNCEGIFNLVLENGTINQQTRIAKVAPISENCEQEILPSSETRMAILGNLFLSEGRPGKVLKVHAKVRIGPKDFIASIRECLEQQFPEKLVGLGGAFLLKKGMAKQHVMRDFSETPLRNEEELNNWLKFYNMSAPLVAVGTLVNGDGLYRHGQRAIISSYPTDPYKNESFWPVPYGELLNVGKNQHYALGKWLRQRYDSFLSRKYMAEEFHIRSSNYDRCLMSAASNLAGLFPPEGAQIWNQALNWQPIPIHTRPNRMDGMLALEKPCPEYKRLLDEQMTNGGPYQKLVASSGKLYAYLTEKTGEKIKDFIGANDLYDTLLVENQANYTLPEWTHSVYPEKLRQQSVIRFQFDTPTVQAAKFGVGQVFDRVLTQFEAKIKGLPVPKFVALSAHDTNVFNILNTLRHPQTELVPYAGMVVFELRKNTDGKYFVNFLYKKADAELVTIKGCESNCDYDKFKAILKPYAMNEEEYDRQCLVKRA